MRQLSDFDYMLDSYYPDSEYLEELRKEFVRKFSVDFIRNYMKLDDYIQGKGSKDSFCYWIERKTANLGSIKGGSVHKFGIWYSKKDKNYHRTDKWMDGSLDEAFSDLKAELVRLIQAGNTEDYEVIQAVQFGPQLKNKILSLYYPKKYLNIFSEDMLSYFLFQFDGIKEHKDLSALEMQRRLISIKMSDKATKNWNNIKFGNYLYHLFPKALDLAKADHKKVDPSVIFKIEYPEVPVEKNEKTNTIVARDVVLVKNTSKVRTAKTNSAKKSDYLRQEVQKQKIGAKGESLAFKSELLRLKDYPELQRKVTQVSLESDSFGYDILSYETDGSKRCIEVKSSNDEPKDKFDFILSENEYKQAQMLDNYWIYRVFKVNDMHPEIYRISNPFNNDNIELSPIKYRAIAKIKKHKE